MSLTPIIDVVFLLLLFFMLASTFTRFAHVDVELGGKSVAGAATAKTLNVLLSISSESEYSVNGVPSSLAKLKEHLTDAAKGEKAKVLVRPSEQATAEQVIRAIEQAGAARIGPVIMMR